jgi:hypothetical protein
MRSTRFLMLFVSLTIVLSFSSLQLYAGEFRDEFNSSQLNTNVWKITKAGKGSFEIKDGKLSIISPAIADGVMLYYNKEITNENIFIEAKIDISGVGTDGSFGFTDAIIDPQLNTDVHPHLNAQFVILPAAWGINDDLRGGRLFDGGGEHVFAVDLKGDTLTWYVDDKEVGKSNRKAESRFFFISPDMYTSHYIGTFAIDYIELSGDGVSAAVSPVGRFATFWGDIKNCK